MGTRTGESVGQKLEELAAEYRHVKEEHERAGAESTVRRHLKARLDELEERFDRLLTEWVGSPELRGEWRKHLHHDGPLPAAPAAVEPAPVFKGKAASGSRVEVREREDGDLDVLVDGSEVERIAGSADFAVEVEPGVVRLAGLEVREIFDAPPRAIAALRDWVDDPAGAPPWSYAGVLAADGLIDRYLSLTPRGRRAVTAVRRI